MKIKIVKFEPSSKAGTFQLQMPAGSQVLMARMTRMGEGNLVVAAPDVETGEVETVTLAALWEDYVRGQAGGDPHDWRHLGCWSFDSGDFQHLFVHEPAQVLELAESVAPSIEDLTARVEKLERGPVKVAKSAKPTPAAEPEKDPG